MHPMAVHPISSNKVIKTYIDSNIVVVGDFNTPYHQYIGHPNKKSIKKF
jgi:hypothetical protein